MLSLYLFRLLALGSYILSGFFPNYYVVSAVVIVVFLAMDFWNTKNVAGRTLVGLRYWNQVDEDGESYWVFESRDVSSYYADCFQRPKCEPCSLHAQQTP